MTLQQTCPVRKQNRTTCTTGFWNTGVAYTNYFPRTDDTDSGRPSSCRPGSKNATCNTMNQQYPGTSWTGSCDTNSPHCLKGSCAPFCYMGHVNDYGQSGVSPNWKSCCLGRTNDNCRCSPQWCPFSNQCDAAMNDVIDGCGRINEENVMALDPNY